MFYDLVACLLNELGKRDKAKTTIESYKVRHDIALPSPIETYSSLLT